MPSDDWLWRARTRDRFVGVLTKQEDADMACILSVVKSMAEIKEGCIVRIDLFSCALRNYSP